MQVNALSTLDIERIRDRFKAACVGSLGSIDAKNLAFASQSEEKRAMAAGLQEFFGQRLDRDHDEQLDHDEWYRAINGAIPGMLTRHECLRLFHCVDTDQSGRVTMHEFKSFLTSRRPSQFANRKISAVPSKSLKAAGTAVMAANEAARRMAAARATAVLRSKQARTGSPHGSVRSTSTRVSRARLPSPPMTDEEKVLQWLRWQSDAAD